MLRSRRIALTFVLIIAVGSLSASRYPAPTASLLANPTTIQQGQSSTLKWTTRNATSVTLNGSSVALSGSKVETPSTTTSYTLVANGKGGTKQITATVTVTIPPPPPTPPPTPAPPPSSGTHFITEPSHSTYLPRTDAYCAAAITQTTWEPRSDNTTANNTVVTPQWVKDGESSWSLWAAKRSQVTGNFKGTTTEIFQWAACKWGIEEDLIRADAVQESNWHQNELGDVCGPVGEASYGILQIKNLDCSGSPMHGGYPQTQQSTALNADWWAAHIRSCYDGDFYDGGTWLYGGKTVDQIAAVNGWDYVLWGCIGAHFSGDWNPTQQYVQQVKQILANKPWTQPNF